MQRGISFFMSSLLTLRGRTNTVHPIIISVLKRLLPTTFPRAMSPLPFIADIALTANSGAEVPNATMVSPITSSETFILFAMEEAPSVRAFAPDRISASPTMNSNISAIITIAKIQIFVLSLQYAKVLLGPVKAQGGACHSGRVGKTVIY